jgi:signal transduction histidine kinase
MCSSRGLYAFEPVGPRAATEDHWTYCRPLEAALHSYPAGERAPALDQGTQRGLVAVRPTTVGGGIQSAGARLSFNAPSPGVVRADFCEAQEVLDRAARTMASSALVSCASVEEVAAELEATALRLQVPLQRLAPTLLDRTLADPRFSEIPPRLAVRAQLDVFAGVAGLVDASLWAPSRPATVECLASTSGVAGSRRLKVLARTTIEDDAVTITGTRSPILGVPVRRNGTSHGALALRLRDSAQRETVEPLAQLAAIRISTTLERQLLLEHGAARAQSVGETIERRLVRTAYDLHDGPMQALAVLADELRLASADVVRLVPVACRGAVADALGSVHEQAAGVEREIREIAQSLETSAVVRRPLTELLEREASSVSGRSGIKVVLDVRANVSELTDSQRIVLYRGIQEALANVARHSGARTATVDIRSHRGGISATVEDDGCGFDTVSLLPAAAKRGRLGFVGITERVRMLGGCLTVHSVPGAGTRVKIALPAWSPLSDHSS